MSRFAVASLAALLTACPGDGGETDDTGPGEVAEDAYLPWTDEAVSFDDLYGCEWARIQGFGSDDRSAFFLHLSLDERVSWEADADFETTLDVPDLAEVLYVVDASPTLEIELAYEFCDAPSPDPAWYDDLGRWWTGTSGEVTIQGTFLYREDRGACGGTTPVYDALITLTDIHFEDAVTGELAAEPLDELVISDVNVGQDFCEE